MKRFIKFFFPALIVAIFFAAAGSFAGQEIKAPYGLTTNEWSTGVAITNLSDEPITELAIDFYPANGDFDVSRDRTVIPQIDAHAMIVEQASKLYPGDAPPTETYSIRIFHNGDQEFGLALFVLNLNQGFGFQQFKSEEFTPMEGDGSTLMGIHASPDAPAVDLRVDGFTAASNLAYPNNTEYLPVADGDRFVEIVVSGTDTAVFQGDLTIAPDTSYSVFAANDAANLEVVVLEDDLTAPEAGNAHVRFIHLSPDAPEVDITLTDGTVVFGGYAFKDASMFTPVAAGPITLQVRAAGTDTVVLELPEITLEDGKIYTIFAKGFLTGTGFQALGAEIIVNK